MFSPDIARFAELVRMSKLREYRYQQQVYYECLLKEILINREVNLSSYLIGSNMYVHPKASINP